MITPLEIENKEFSKSMRGYSAEEVDEFLNTIIVDLQQLLMEKSEMEITIGRMKEEIAQYRQSERSVLATLESAKKLMNDISESAEKRAEIIIKNAMLEAEVIQKDAKESVSRLTEEGEALTKKVTRFRERYRQLLEDELSDVDTKSGDILSEFEKDFMRQPEAKPVRTQKPASKPAGGAPEPGMKVRSKKNEGQKAPAAKPAQGASKATTVIRNEDFERLAKSVPDKSKPADDKFKTKVIK